MPNNFVKSSFLEDFEIPEITHENIQKQLLKVGNVQSTSKRASTSSLPLNERIKRISEEVYKILGRYKGFVKVIYTKEELHSYISKAISIDYLSFDTETNRSLDPLTCKLVGLCLYMPNTRPVYVPINHCKAGTSERLENQVTEEEAKEELLLLSENATKLVYHNAKFDIRVIHGTLGFYLPVWWDTMIAAQLLDENELARLKYQYKAHVNPTIGTYNIEALFEGLPYEWFDPEVFALYAAIDAYDTSKLQKYQESMFTQEGMERLYNLFLNIEVPVVSITASMEDNGICIDKEFLAKLDTKYKKEVERINKKLQEILSPYQENICYYQGIGKLDNPINFDSPAQLSIVLYEILKAPQIEGSKSTDKATLKALKLPFTEALLEYRHYAKLISSFTTPLPEWISTMDDKLHASFNQLGKEDNNVRTGRFSSSNPKQNWGFVA